MSKLLFLSDFLSKFPEDSLVKIPKISHIKITTNLNNKSFSNIYHSSNLSTSPSSLALLQRILFFSSIFGQSPQIIQVSSSIANWNIRKGLDNGLLLTLRPSHPFFSEFFFLFYPLILHQDLSLSFSNKSDPSTSNFGLPSLQLFSPLLPLSSSLLPSHLSLSSSQLLSIESSLNLLQNSIEFIGLRFHFSSSFSLSSSHSINALKHQFILAFFKLPSLR